MGNSFSSQWLDKLDEALAKTVENYFLIRDVESNVPTILKNNRIVDGDKLIIIPSLMQSGSPTIEGGRLRSNVKRVVFFAKIDAGTGLGDSLKIAFDVEEIIERLQFHLENASDKVESRISIEDSEQNIKDYSTQISGIVVKYNVKLAKALICN